MRRFSFAFTVIILLNSCAEKSEPGLEPETSVRKEQKSNFVNKLYIFEENRNLETHEAYPDVTEDFYPTYALCLTEKGNAIVHLINDPSDTMSYYYGKYSITDSTISYQLSEEFYYPGKWDDRLNLKELKINEGKTRAYQGEVVRLKKPNIDAKSYTRIGNSNHLHEAAHSHSELEYWPYVENENEKFITWTIKQIPQLADL